MKATKTQIDNFLSQPHIAIAGYSREKNKFGNQVYSTLQEKGLKLYPVNPAGGNTPAGETIYASLSDLPPEVKALYIITKPETTAKLVEEGLQMGFSHFWIQQMSENEQAKQLLADNPNAVLRQCILLHANPTGIHRFHHRLASFFRVLPR